MTEVLEVAKLIIASKVVPQTALIMMLPAIFNSVTSTIFDFLVLYLVIKYRRGLKQIILKLCTWNGDHE